MKSRSTVYLGDGGDCAYCNLPVALHLGELRQCPPDSIERDSLGQITIDARTFGQEFNDQMMALMLKKYGVVEQFDEGIGGGAGKRPSSWGALKTLIGAGAHLAVVTHWQRPGASNFIVTLEHDHYEPATKRNALMRIFTSLWLDTLWGVVLVPWNERELVKRHAKRCGLKLADGVPTLITVEQGRATPEFFPTGDHPHIFTLENRKGSPVYEMSPGALMASLREEMHLIDEYVERFYRERASRAQRN
jgi:hypothetical protein